MKYYLDNYDQEKIDFAKSQGVTIMHNGTNTKALYPAGLFHHQIQNPIQRVSGEQLPDSEHLYLLSKPEWTASQSDQAANWEAFFNKFLIPHCQAYTKNKIASLQFAMRGQQGSKDLESLLGQVAALVNEGLLQGAKDLLAGIDPVGFFTADMKAGLIAELDEMINKYFK